MGTFPVGRAGLTSRETRAKSSPSTVNWGDCPCWASPSLGFPYVTWTSKINLKGLLLFTFPNTGMSELFQSVCHCTCTRLMVEHRQKSCLSSGETDKKGLPPCCLAPLLIFSPLFFHLWLRKQESAQHKQRPSFSACRRT